VLGSLNHQNIAAIYGVEQEASASGGSSIPVLVMELVEGQTLAERIDAGPLPIDEALSIAAQMAEALDAAHELGIIHRDLKPANVKLRPDGTVKVLDFGLAKIAEPAGVSQISATAATYSPTFSLAASRAGMIIGTAAYMAPEQARGRIVDKRADLWAFGVVLFEMLTGEKAFAGEDVSDTLASVIKFDPDWTRLPADTPVSIRRLLKRCLVKDPKLRLRDCGSALLDIREAQSGDSSAGSSVASGVVRRGPSWLLLIAVAALAAAGGAGLWASRSRPTPVNSPPTRRFTITLPEDQNLPTSAGTVISISPDGRTILYREGAPGPRQLLRRSIDQFDATAIPGITDPSGAQMSPDGKWLIFESARTLKKMPATGGPAQTLTALAPAGSPRGYSWTPDGDVVFALYANGGPVMRVSMAGGGATELFKAPDDRRPSYPQVIQDGKAVLFTLIETASDPGELHARRFDTSEQRVVLREATAGRVLSSGHLVFVRSGSLWAVPFDKSRLEPRGTAVPVIEGIRVETGGAVQYDVANDGTLVFIPGTSANLDQRPLQFVAADGRVGVLSAVPRAYTSAALSPDGTRIAVGIDSGDAADVWVVDVVRGALTRLTAEPGFDGDPVWSPDGLNVAFTSNRGGIWSLNRKLADGTGNIEQLATFRGLQGGPGGGLSITAWTADGQMIATVNRDIGVVPANGKGEWKPLIHTSATETQAVISPDGRWIAYASNETSAAEVYVQRFPDLGNRQLVSVGGGLMPTWSHDGRVLFYLGGGGPPRTIMRAAIEPTRDGLRISPPVKVTDWRFYGAQGAPRYYDIAADGRALVIGRTINETATKQRQINVVVNWTDELKQKVPIR
jgi:serine/threonine-protein kinase